MNNFGYGGKILRVDLLQRNYTIEGISPNWFKNVIGGRAANSKRLLEELDHQCDPLGPKNLLIFGIGPLTGSLLPASAYYTVSAKSPLTGILGDSAAGGHFAAEMKLTGYDQIILTNSADQLIYILIQDDKINFIECPDLKNKTILETTSFIRESNQNHHLQVAAIGPAGENQVLFSSIVSSGNRVNGRCGMGAVMGSKNLKAIALCGTNPLKIYDPITALDQAKKIKSSIEIHQEYQKRHTLGTTMLVKDLNSLGILPTNHFQEGVCDYVSQISGETLAQKYKVKNKSCFNCPIHCSRYYIHQDIEAEGPEFETLCGFTSRIGNKDITFALYMNYFLNQVGMDSLSTCEIIGWLMECQNKGLIKPKDIDNITLSWGNIEDTLKIIKKIVYNQGIGQKLKYGATIFSKNFSKEAQELVMQVRGLDMICGDPRGIKAYGLTYAISSRGADHLRAEPYFELTNDFVTAKKRFNTEKAADRLSEEGKAELVTYSEKIALLTDCLTMCKNIGLCMDILNLQNSSILLKSFTGINYTPQALQKYLSDSINREFELNNKFGFDRKNSTLPKRFINEPLKKGASKGSTVNIKAMTEKYYKLH